MVLVEFGLFKTQINHTLRILILRIFMTEPTPQPKNERRPTRPSKGLFVLSILLVFIVFAGAFFYGVIGEDKYILLAPLALTGYGLLALGLLWLALSRKTLTTAPPGFFLLLLFVIWGVSLIPRSAIPYESTIRMLFIGLFVGAYYYWGNALTLFRRNRWLLGLILFFVVGLALYGLINHFKNPEQVLWVKRYAPYPGRLASTYICPNHFAHIMQMLLPFCLVLLFIPRAGFLIRMLAGCSIIAFAPALYFTESRAGMLGSLLALGVTICLMALRKNKIVFMLLVIVVPLTGAAVLGLAWKHSEMFHRRMTPVVNFLTEAKEKGFAETTTRDFRPLTWLDSYEMAKEKPITGFGPATYRFLFPKHRNRFKGNKVVTGHPHNEYLEVATEYGFLGLGLLALAWLYGLIRLFIFSLRTPNQHHAFMAMAFLGTAAGTMLHSFFDFQMHVFQNALLFAFLGAIAAGPMVGRKQEKLSIQTNRAGNIFRRILRIALALAALSAFIYSVTIFSSAFLRSKAQRLLKTDPEQAEKTYLKATHVDPHNWRAYKGLGEIYFSKRHFSLDPMEKRAFAYVERNHFKKAYTSNPLDAPLVYDYGMTLLFLKNKDQGLDLLKQAAELRPYNDEFWWHRGIAQRKEGEYEAALESFNYAYKLHRAAVTRANIKWLKRVMKEQKK